jgi:type III restriction enzyme
LISELQEEFASDKCMVINSKEDSVEKQLLVNSLEDENNEYRVVFAVDKLNEGWDVLNLFDIVRLYDKKSNYTKGKVGKTTMSEAQLIGRGARYCPFQITKEQPLYQRKFDTELGCEMQICEELYYHAAYNPKYITELNTALVGIGIKASKDERLVKTKRANKKKRQVYQKVHSDIKNRLFTHELLTGNTVVSRVFENLDTALDKKSEKIFELHSFGIPLVRKALRQIPFYQFDNLQS